MKKGIDKFLTSDKVLYSLPWIYAICTLAFEIFNIISGIYISIFELGLEIINILIVFGIAISYKAHEKNIMKTLFGAVIMGQIIYTFNFITSIFGITEYIFTLVLTIIGLLLYIVLFINHLILGYGHKASPDRVKLNRVVGLLIFIVICISRIPNYISAEMIISGILGILAETSIILEILCIETKVDAYKIIRESK